MQVPGRAQDKLAVGSTEKYSEARVPAVIVSAPTCRAQSEVGVTVVAGGSVEAGCSSRGPRKGRLHLDGGRQAALHANLTGPAEVWVAPWAQKAGSRRNRGRGTLGFPASSG